MESPNKEQLKEEIKKFVDSMKNKTLMPHNKVLEMFKLNELYFKEKETQPDCELCVVRVFTRLKKLVK